MRSAIRKCSICKESIDTNSSNEDFFITLNEKSTSCTHSECYIKHHTSEQRRKPKTIEECKFYIDECKEKYKKSEIKKSVKSELYEFLFEMYGISYLPKHFYIKMDSIYKGTFKNLNRPIPPEDLLDMWKQKKNYLLRVAEQNRKKGTDISGVNCVNYDLAILLSKYDSYLKWKEQQELAVAEINESKKRSIERIDYTDVVRPKRNNTTSGSIDINSMLDEI